jgi:hypothetical protein
MPTRQLMRVAPKEAARQADQVRESAYASRHVPGTGSPAEAAQRIRDGVEGGEPRVEAVGRILKDHLDQAALGHLREAVGRYEADVATLEPDAAV